MILSPLAFFNHFRRKDGGKGKKTDGTERKSPDFSTFRGIARAGCGDIAVFDGKNRG